MRTMFGDGEMRARQTFTRHMLYVVSATAAILLVPLVAMQFTNEVNWDGFDFAVAGALLFGTGLMYAITAKLVANRRHRTIIGFVLAAALLLVWAELAVGIFS